MQIGVSFPSQNFIFLDELLSSKDLQRVLRQRLLEVFKEKEMISKPKFRFWDQLPAKAYRKIRYIRKKGVLNTLKFKLGLSTPQEEFVMEEDRGVKKECFLPHTHESYHLYKD